MADGNIVKRLELDAGSLTFGQLVQDREIARQEIIRLEVDNARLKSSLHLQLSEASDGPTGIDSLVSLKDVCKLVGVSRSTIYKWISDGNFPQPIRIGKRAVRWSSQALVVWRETHNKSSR